MSPPVPRPPDITRRPAAARAGALSFFLLPGTRYLLAILFAVITYKHTPPFFRNLAAWDVWDFIYYAFTIAMCYQTSDVSITSPSMRRLTIGHAIFSFLFVLLLFGMVVNIIANVI